MQVNIDNISEDQVKQCRKLAHQQNDRIMIDFCDKMIHSENGEASASFAVVRYYNRSFAEDS